VKLYNTIIYLLGVPAVGKYTTARAIARLTGAKVVDNQLINIPVFSVIGYDGTAAFPFPPGAWAHIEEIRNAVFAVVRDFCPVGDSFVFTNVLGAHDPGDEALFRRVERLAAHRNAAFFPVWLTCDAEHLRQRKGSEQRRARFKDTDLTTIKSSLEEFMALRVSHPNALTLDTSRSKPEQTARHILDHVQATKSRTGLYQHST
jgi:predicted kinase